MQKAMLSFVDYTALESALKTNPRCESLLEFATQIVERVVERACEYSARGVEFEIRGLFKIVTNTRFGDESNLLRDRVTYFPYYYGVADDHVVIEDVAHSQDASLTILPLRQWLRTMPDEQRVLVALYQVVDSLDYILRYSLNVGDCYIVSLASPRAVWSDGPALIEDAMASIRGDLIETLRLVHKAPLYGTISRFYNSIFDDDIPRIIHNGLAAPRVPYVARATELGLGGEICVAPALRLECERASSILDPRVDCDDVDYYDRFSTETIPPTYFAYWIGEVVPTPQEEVNLIESAESSLDSNVDQDVGLLERAVMWVASKSVDPYNAPRRALLSRLAASTKSNSASVSL